VWRTRVNTECKYLLLKYCFEELKLQRVQFKTDVQNKRSRAAIMRLGATQEGIIRKHMVLPEEYVRDSVIFSIIDDEWPAVKKRLEGFLHAASQGNKENASN
jgi:RimJ/RimL family protein N-acetyltransferase